MTHSTQIGKHFYFAHLFETTLTILLSSQQTYSALLIHPIVGFKQQQKLTV